MMEFFSLRPKPIAGPLKVFRKDELIGTVPGYPVTSTSFIYDVRPSDFLPAVRDGEKVLEAAWNVCPGDFECIEGFRRADGRPTEKGEIASLFDAMVAAAKAPRR